jgi:hypothetical protein
MSSTDIGGDFGEARPAGGASGSPAKDMAQDAAHAVKQEAASFAADAKEKAAETIDQKKETASRTLGDFANAVRKAGDELARSDQSMATQFVRQAADGLEGFARTISDKRPEEMLEAVREFGRRNPTVFVAGCVLAGVAIGRLLRSSASHSEDRAMDRSASFSAPGGAPPTYPLGDLDVGAPTDGSWSQAAAGSAPGLEPDADRFGSRS